MTRTDDRPERAKRKLEPKENSDRYWNKYPRKDRHDDEDKGKKTNRNENISAEQKIEENKPASAPPPRERKNVDLLTSRTGGAYIPPAKLRLMQAEITDKSSVAYQRIAWEALKKSIHGCINKVNTSNIGVISVELLHENIVRGRGLLCKSIIQAQTVSPTFTNVYAALVAVINSKFPNIGELLLKRLVLQFKRGFKQNNKTVCISSATFIAHLVNQRVAHEILALEILTLLVESPTDDSVEVAIAFLKECGQKLTEVSRKGINAIFEMLRNILHEGKLDKRIQYMIEVMYQIRKDGFKDHAAVIQELDVVNEEDQFTHLITLDDVKQANAEDILNVFKFDEKYEENEGKYKMLSKEILGSDEESGSEESGEEDDEDEEEEDEEEKSQIIDNTETNLTILRRTIYLTIQSSLDYEECAHKLLKMELKPGQEIEMCHMFLDCCAEQRTYEKFYGLLAQRFCQINKMYVEPFQTIFKNTFSTAHRLDTNRIRNVSKFCAHLLYTDAISWEVLEIIKLNEEESNSSSRVFVKILFQELAEYMGLAKLNARLKEPTLQPYFTGLFPKDNPKNTRFAINFFTSIGLGFLTDELREHLNTTPKMAQLSLVVPEESSSSSSSSSSSDSSSSDSSSESEDESQKRKQKNRKDKKMKPVSGENTDIRSSKKERNHKEASDDEKRKKSDYGKERKQERGKQKYSSVKEQEECYEQRNRSDKKHYKDDYKHHKGDERYRETDKYRGEKHKEDNKYRGDKHKEDNKYREGGKHYSGDDKYHSKEYYRDDKHKQDKKYFKELEKADKYRRDERKDRRRKSRSKSKERKEKYHKRQS